MTVYFFAKGDKNAGSSRLRAFYVAEYLEKIGVKTVVYNISNINVSNSGGVLLKKIRSFVEYLKILRKIKKEDVIFLQRTLYNKYFIVLIIAYKIIWRRKMIFDFDDALYLHHPIATKFLSKASDAVVVAYHYSSQEWAKKYNKNVFMVPTSIPFEIYSKRLKDYSQVGVPWTIGWIGNGRDHFCNLEILGDVFKRLKNDGFNFKFRVVGAMNHKPLYDFFQNILGSNAEFVDALEWSNPEKVIEEILKFDISVVPLIFTEWNRGKYSLKAIESMSLGIPTVLSSTEGAKDLIKDGENGFLVNDKNDWFDALKNIMQSNLDFYKKIGLNGRVAVSENYSLESNVIKIKNIIENL